MEKEEKKTMQGTSRQAIAFELVTFHPFERVQKGGRRHPFEREAIASNV